MNVEKVEVPSASVDILKVNIFGLSGMIGLARLFKRFGLDFIDPENEWYVIGALVGLFSVVD